MTSVTSWFQPPSPRGFRRHFLASPCPLPATPIGRTPHGPWPPLTSTRMRLPASAPRAWRRTGANRSGRFGRRLHDRGPGFGTHTDNAGGKDSAESWSIWRIPWLFRVRVLLRVADRKTHEDRSLEELNILYITLLGIGSAVWISWVKVPSYFC